MAPFYLWGGRARCQADCGLSLACIMDVLLSAFRREYLNWHQKICSDAIEIRGEMCIMIVNICTESYLSLFIPRPPLPT